MNILYHHRTQGKTVEGVHIREVINALRELGHVVNVVSPPGIDPFADIKILKDNKSKSKAAKVLAWMSKHMPQVGFELLELFYNFVGYANIRKVLAKEKIDFIYERYAFFSFAGTLLAQKYHIPIILEVNEVSGIKRQRGQVLIGLANRIEKMIFSKVHAIVTVSGYLKRHIENMKINGNIHIVPNAVNIKEFSTDISGDRIRQLLEADNKIVLGFVGSFSVWDNLPFLIEAFEEISKKNGNLLLMLVGDGFNKGELEEAVNKKGLNDKVYFPGRVVRKEMPEYIAAMDLCVIPHSNPFGSPVVLFEYMAMAKPVIAPRLGPIIEVIDDGVNGAVFELEDKISFKAKTVDLIVNVQKRRQIGIAARDTILSKYLWKCNVEQVIFLYQKMKEQINNRNVIKPRNA
jgi:glycosyltransferase involved in cell wall biosynthesis